MSAGLPALAAPLSAPLVLPAQSKRSVTEEKRNLPSNGVQSTNCSVHAKIQDMTPLRLYRGREIGFPLVKVLNREMRHHGYQYKIGWNGLSKDEPFSVLVQCSAGGLYCAPVENVRDWYGYGDRVALVTPLPDTQLYLETAQKFKCEGFMISQPIEISNPLYDGILRRWCALTPVELLQMRESMFAVSNSSLPMEKESNSPQPKEKEKTSMAEHAASQLESKKRHQAFWQQMFQRDCTWILSTPTLYQTRESWEAFVKAHPRQLSLIPIEFTSQVLWHQSVKLNPSVFYKMPPQCQTQEICNFACDHNLSFNFEYVLPQFQTEEMRLELVARDGSNLSRISVQTEKICWVAVHQSLWNFSRVKEPRLELCRYAIIRDFYMLKWARHQSEDLCWAAMRSNVGLYFEFVRKPTMEMCWYALKRIPRMIQYIVSPSEEMCLYVVGYDGLLLEHIRPEKQTQKICSAAVARDTGAFQFVDRKYQELCQTANPYATVLPKDKQIQGRCIGASGPGSYIDWRALLKDWDATHATVPTATVPVKEQIQTAKDYNKSQDSKALEANVMPTAK